MEGDRDRGALMLVEHGDWTAAFEEEAARVREALGPRVAAVEHVGSTAIPQVPAKPVVDILAGLLAMPLDDEQLRALRRLGYVSRQRAGRRYFRRGSPRSHFLHVVLFEGREWRRYLFFRDYLRARPEEAAAYARLKRDLVARAPVDPGTYAREKTRWIDAAVQRAEAGG
jgi:GrpB-like predicted nucleotidyltransferase (UPF0157 family)